MCNLKPLGFIDLPVRMGSSPTNRDKKVPCIGGLGKWQ